MKLGDKIKIDFAGKKKEGVVIRLFPNSVHLKMDFDKHKGKIIKRKINEISKEKTAKKTVKKAKTKDSKKTSK